MKLHEECGVMAIWRRDKGDVASLNYYGLYALQHRGQESCGIAVNDGGVISCVKGLGIVPDVFSKQTLSDMPEGTMSLGHVRYAVSGTDARSDMLPMVVRHVKGNMAIACNSSLTNSETLREKLTEEGVVFHTGSDAEVIANLVTRQRLSKVSIEEAIVEAMNELEGAYSFVIISPRKMIAVRDPHGFHPLCMGTLDDGFAIASESCALDSVGAKFMQDVAPGEVVIIDPDGTVRFDRTHVNEKKKTTCVFEYIYFARPDSVIDGSSVAIARQRAGAFLALEHPVAADVVIGVPDSGIDAAIGYAKQSGIPYGVGFIKNKYIGRTFIQPTQKNREDLVRIKLNPIASVVAGKRVVLVDDSIVRGTTSGPIVKLLREAGATEVHMRSSAPAFKFRCYHGTDVPDKNKLIAHSHSVEEIRDIIGVDSLGYLSCANVHLLADNSEGFCTACFDGNYPDGEPTDEKNKYAKKLEEQA